MGLVELPEGLSWLRASAEGRRWLADVPRVVDACAARWSLRLGSPFQNASVSLAIPGVTTDGIDVVLKIQFPHREDEHEAAALEHWGGDGAVRLLDHDADRNALLLERCSPGTPLSEIAPAEALEVLTELLPRLWVPASAPFTCLTDEASRWAGSLPRNWARAGQPFERRLLDSALEALHALPHTQGEQVLLNQDLHAGNVLRAAREPWLVIDPKPLVGEREFGVAPIVRDGTLGHAPGDAARRLDRLCERLGLDRQRSLGWTVAQTLAWGFDGDRVLHGHIRVADELVKAT